MTFLDTNAALLLYEGKKRIPVPAQRRLDSDDLVLSPMARLEFDFLHEIGALRAEPLAVWEFLQRNLDVSMETEGWVRAAEIATALNWTRDPFDRLITAHALVWSAPLLTRDGVIQEHYQHAFWDVPPAYGR